MGRGNKKKMATTNKKIWFRIKRLFLEATDDSIGTKDVPKDSLPPAEELTSIYISADWDGAQTKAALYIRLNVDRSFILKLRNSRKSLIPINGKLSANSRLTPYDLEVLYPHQNVKPTPGRRQSIHEEDCLRQIENRLATRLDQLEQHWPECQTKRANKINEDIHDLQNRLDFMSKRFSTEEGAQWQGMFKRQPLW